MISYFRMVAAHRNVRTAALLAFVSLTVGQIAYSQTTPDSDAGATTYKKSCATCHAADGSGTALGKRLHAPDLRTKEVQDQTPEALTKIVTAGKANMPAFGNRLTSQQIQQVVDYIRQFHADAAK